VFIDRRSGSSKIESERTKKWDIRFVSISCIGSKFWLSHLPVQDKFKWINPNRVFNRRRFFSAFSMLLRSYHFEPIFTFHVRDRSRTKKRARSWLQPSDSYHTPTFSLIIIEKKNASPYLERRKCKIIGDVKKRTERKIYAIQQIYGRNIISNFGSKNLSRFLN